MRPVVRRVLVVLSLLAALLPASPAKAAATIEFLNPSGYSSATNKQLSNLSDSDSAYHLVAWVGAVPTNPLVEFEIQTTGQNAQTITATRVGSSDTWEAFWEIPDSDSDGAYTLRARLYSSSSEVDNDEETVMINRDPVPPPAPAETAEISYPADGGSFGFFTPKGKDTNGVITVKTSDGATQVRAFYTLSDPGNEPVWTLCGFGSVNAQLIARIRCTLKSGDLPGDVAAVAAVANRTPTQTDPNAGLDDSGDAHRVIPYVQQPTSFNINPQAQSLNPGASACTGAIVATLLDQTGQPIAQANVDVHAVGPNDQLRFGERANSETSGFQNPDKAHISKEFAINCSNGSNSTINQGDHNVPGGDDTKHIESTGGTSNAGVFAFALHADEVGGTSFTVWADEDDDDLMGSSEAAGGGRIGWGQPPPPPVDAVSLSPSSSTAGQGNCQKVTLTLTEDGTALSGKNVDVHASGPDSSVAFCDAGTGLPRAPDQGGHTGYSDPDGKIHGEGETDASGHFSFGITSDSVGATSLAAWMDKSDDDLQGTDEPAANGQINWQEAGRRSITISSNKSPVEKGSKVRLSGRIKGDNNCLDSEVVKLQSRRHGGASFKGAGKTTSGSTGRYSFSKRVKRSTDYRVVAPKNGFCAKAKSRAITVRAT